MAPEKIATLLLLIEAAITKQTLAAIQTENAQDFSFLCGIANLKAVEPKKPSVAADFMAKLKELRQMNVKTADQNWQKQFDGKKQTLKWRAKKAEYKRDDVRKHWAGQWVNWIDDHHRAYKEDEGKKWHQKNPTPADDWAKAPNHAAINTTLYEAIQVVSDYKSAKTEATTTKPATPKQAILEALYGRGAAATAKIGTFTTPSGENHATKCAANGGKSLSNDMLCICGLEAGGASDECGISGVTISFEGSTASSIQALKDKCPKAKPPSPTPTTIMALVAAVASRLRVSGNSNTAVIHLGKIAGAGGTCSGANTECCVIYTKYFTEAENKGGKSIPCVAKLV
uniref:Variant surface glycoprotein 1125.1458 n=1 Tax=Trypanosoma brucei TaxID=5691 RepID=A0A1J0R7D1_9TRYP|nr:variant surface glycoprotein 1125.1458 [Trypanosoma brucei]